MAHVRLQAIQRQNGPPLARQHAPQPFAARKRGRQQLVVAVEQVGHAALSDLHPPPAQGRVDLRHASMVAVTQSADQGHHVQPKLVLRQRDRALLLRPIRPVVARAADLLAPAYLQPQPHRT